MRYSKAAFNPQQGLRVLPSTDANSTLRSITTRVPFVNSLCSLRFNSRPACPLQLSQSGN